MELTTSEKIDKIQSILGDWFSWMDVPIWIVGQFWLGVVDRWGDTSHPVLGKVMILVPAAIVLMIVSVFWWALSQKHGAFKGALMVVPVLSWVLLKAFGRYMLVVLTLGAVMGAAGIAGGQRRR